MKKRASDTSAITLGGDAPFVFTRAAQVRYSVLYQIPPYSGIEEATHPRAWYLVIKI